VVYERYGSYAAGLAALAVVALGALLLTVTVVAARPHRRSTVHA
jgi:hypothetical protein